MSRYRAQGSLEYLAMVGMVIILVMVAMIMVSHRDVNVKELGKSSEQSSLQVRVEMVAQKYNDSAWWSVYGGYYSKCMKGNVSACQVILDSNG